MFSARELASPIYEQRSPSARRSRGTPRPKPLATGTGGPFGVSRAPLSVGVPEPKKGEVDCAPTSAFCAYGRTVRRTVCVQSGRRMELSEIAIVGNVSNVLVWVGLRALLGLYPGYGIDQVEELRRQTYAVGATLAIISIFALVFHVGDLLSRLLLVLGFLSLLLLAPLMRHFVKRGMMRAGVWGKPVVILEAGEVGAG